MSDCDACAIKKIYSRIIERRRKANELTREVVLKAKKEHVPIDYLVGSIINLYMMKEIAEAERDAAQCAYDEGYSEGFTDGKDVLNV